MEPEPTGNTDLGRWIRRELKEHTMPNRQLQTLFIANRVEHFQRLNELMRRGITVIMDRGELSTAAYGAASGDFTLQEVLDLHRRANIPQPDLLLFFDIPHEEAVRRARERPSGKERFDDNAFQKRLDGLYRQLRKMSGFNWVDIDATGTTQEVHKKVLGVLRERGLLRGRRSKAGALPISFRLTDTVVSLDESCRIMLQRMVIDRYMGVDVTSWVKVKEQPAEIADAADKLDRFLKTVSEEVEKKWFAKQLTKKDVFILLFGESGELGEYIVKEKRDKKNYHKEISAEAVDLVFYLAKALTDANVDIKNVWSNMTFNISRQRELVMLGEQSSETIAQIVGLMCSSLGALSDSQEATATINLMLDSDDERRENEAVIAHYRHICDIDKDDTFLPPQSWVGYQLTFNFETGAAIALYLTLKLIEKLDVDFDDAWQSKMQFNSERF